MQLLRRVFGVFLIIVGVIALVTPFTPGSWLIFVGAELLGWELVYAKRVKEYLQRWWKGTPKNKSEAKDGIEPE